jgi:hypothetical protein
MGSIFASIKTTAIGLAVAICGGAHLTGVIPADWLEVINGVCGVLVGLGLVAAKDANVSNAVNPAVAHTVK